ncbi:MAG: putative rRNA maturation factor [Candidatus Gottesmanbacteria bacterium GW2011_GWA1_34_13]|uniref:Putative rRNA maturation factor n=1 Tax=Candidatus Gottesmanbacteria bacterium GW2011_GWA1_34_13 TaxID=1618434 RepID=A0A0G0AR09_9BACT|nr:MAG: putative rRNA maturation factor [Candidatus Gottesmanbacteria bacterium GW2011_GWA1_34_13]
MINVLIYKESRFPADRERISKFVKQYLENKIKMDAEVCVSIVGDRKMRHLNSQYRHHEDTTDVLSFPLTDPQISSQLDIQSGFSPDKSAPDKYLRLGDIVISYPQAVMEAAQGNLMVDTKIEELIAHGLDHLMGIHHE